MAVFSAIGSVLSSKSQKKAASKAADVSLQVARENNALAKDIYGENKATLSPFVGSGMNALSLLEGGIGIGDDTAYRNAFGNFIANSDYGFQFGEGSNALNSGYAAASTLQSGDAMRELEKYRQNLQSGYRGEFNNLLANQQSLGLGAASAQAGVGQNYVNTVSANNDSAGTAQANALLMRGANNPWANAFGSVGGAIQRGVGAYLGGGL